MKFESAREKRHFVFMFVDGGKRRQQQHAEAGDGAQVRDERYEVKPSVKHLRRGSTPSKAGSLFDRFAGSVVGFTDSIELLPYLFQFLLLVGFEGSRLFGSSLHKLGKLFFSASHEFIL